MTRLNPVNRETADTKTTQLLNGVEKKLGVVPNMIATMAQSNAVANAYLGFSSALAGGRLSAQVREQIALAVAQQNSCNYCIAAHSTLGAGAGLDEDAIMAARKGNSEDDRTDTILSFATRLVEARGHVSDEELNLLREKGLDDGEIAEVVASVVLNIFTNYFNHVADTKIDFPMPAEIEIGTA